MDSIRSEIVINLGDYNSLETIETYFKGKQQTRWPETSDDRGSATTLFFLSKKISFCFVADKQ